MRRRILSLGRRDDFFKAASVTAGPYHCGDAAFLRGKETKEISMPLCGDTFDEKVGAARASADARERRLVVPHQDARSPLGTAAPTLRIDLASSSEKSRVRRRERVISHELHPIPP